MPIDPRDQAIVDAVVERLAAEFGPRHEKLAERLSDVERRLNDLDDHVGFVEVFAQALDRKKRAGQPAETPQPPGRHAARPAAIDRACAVSPEDGAQRVDLPQCGLVAYPKPGSDPKVTWGNLRALPIQGEGIVNDDVRQTPHPPRTSRN